MKVSKLLKLHGMLVLTVHPDFTLAEAARRFATSVGGRRFSLVGAFSVGMGLLLAATVLSYYKPWGRIPWP